MEGTSMVECLEVGGNFNGDCQVVEELQCGVSCRWSELQWEVTGSW